MVRGCQRRVIFIKNTGSAVFSEAYFIVDDKEKAGSYSEPDMIKEANRIIDESIFTRCAPRKREMTRGSIITTVLTMLPAFILGAILTSAVFMIFVI